MDTSLSQIEVAKGLISTIVKSGGSRHVVADTSTALWRSIINFGHHPVEFGEDVYVATPKDDFVGSAASFIGEVRSLI